MQEQTLQIEERFAFSAFTPDEDLDFSHEEFEERVGVGFNEYGVRENRENGELKSVDVIFEAMEPGPPDRRNGVRITEDFLDKVAEKDYDKNPPHLKDHKDKDTFARIGDVRNIWFSDRLSKLMVMVRTPNIEGSQNHSEAIARYTHEPPAIRDGSLGFGRQYEAVRNDDGEPEMRDGKIREFSTVNFPGGYDEGGVNTAFAEAIEEELPTFASAAGVSWSGTKEGKLDRSEIPNEDYEDHFMYDGEKKSDSSYPVVDGEGNLRRGNVKSAWELGARGVSVSSEEHDERVKELASYFDNPPVPMENSQFFEFDSHDLNSVYSKWSDEVNMTASQLERWADHPCSDIASEDPEAVRKRNLTLLRKNKSEWTDSDLDDAKRTISFISRMRGQRPDEPSSGGKGTCPSEWAVSLLNWAYNPFDGMPDGDPNPEENSISTTVIEFNDPAGDDDKSGENSAVDAVETETIQF